jgi:hypothetical protein
MQKVKEAMNTILVVIITLEIFSFIAIKYFHYTNLWYKFPTYANWGKTIKESYDPLGPHYIDTDLPWSTWHLKNTEIRHKGDCFDVKMKFNEIGARGILPNKDDTNTTVFLGDSFIEGFGLAENQTISDQYSKTSNTPVLNLGAGGSFGTTQMAMIYDSIGQIFKHKRVIVCLYLENDFTDDDITKSYPSRYRPYLVKNKINGRFEIKYKEDSLKKSMAKADSYYKGQMVNLIKKYSIGDYFSDSTIQKSGFQKFLTMTYSARMLVELYNRANSKNFPPLETSFTNENAEILQYNIDKICKRAALSGAEVCILNIPSKYLLQLHASNPKYKTTIDSLISKSIGAKKAKYLDLTENILSQKVGLNNIFFECDAHFNAIGAKIVAEYLNNAIK